MTIPRTQPHRSPSIRRRPVTAVVASLVLAVAVLTATGCRMLKSSTGETLERIGLRWQPLGYGRDVIQLEFMTLRRPGNDPLLGESLWNRLDTIGRRPARSPTAPARSATLTHPRRLSSGGRGGGVRSLYVASQA